MGADLTLWSTCVYLSLVNILNTVHFLLKSIYVEHFTTCGLLVHFIVIFQVWFVLALHLCTESRLPRRKCFRNGHGWKSLLHDLRHHGSFFVILILSFFIIQTKFIRLNYRLDHFSIEPLTYLINGRSRLFIGIIYLVRFQVVVHLCCQLATLNFKFE